MNEPKEVYFVAVKLLLRRKHELIITHDIFGSWDIPGGRIKPDEFQMPLEDVINRKIKEELGHNIRFELGKPVVFFQHERIEHSNGKPVRIFAVGYEANYLSGQIQLGSNHDKYEWVALDHFKPEEYFEGGWLKGLKEYLSSHKTL